MTKTGIVSVVVLLTTTVWASDVGDAGFQNYNCYKDLCVSRLQFCSDREQRCKLCQPAHCINRDLTPKECIPLCPELQKPSTTTATILKTLTTLQPYISKTSSPTKPVTPKSTRNDSAERFESCAKTNNRGGIFVPWGVFLLVAGILLIVLLVLVTLGVCILRHVKDIRRRLPLSSEETVEKGRMLESEEEEALLKTELRTNSSSKASGSASTVSSEPTKSSSPGLCHQQQQQQQHQHQNPAVAFNTPVGESLPPYTARPSSQLLNADGGHYSGVAPSSAAEVPIDSLQHQKSHNYQLMSGNGYDHVQDACFQSPPVWERSGHQGEFPYTEETCHKTL